MAVTMQDEEILGYRLIKMLGAGRMNRLCIVEEKATCRQMTLSFFDLSRPSPGNSYREKFLYEMGRATMLAEQLVHKNILQVYKAGQSGDDYFILAEYCEGGHLYDFLYKNGERLPIDTATNIMLQVLDGLIYAHSTEATIQLNDEAVQVKGIVHLDINPGNIFLTGEGKELTAKLANFGFQRASSRARFYDFESGPKPVPLLFFMPKQQIIDIRNEKPELDVWATAAVYYFMLTGKYPKDFPPVKDAVDFALKNAAVPIRERNPDIPEKLAEVIDRALIEKPEIGVKSAAELKGLIEEYGE